MLKPSSSEASVFDLTSDELDRYPAGIVTLDRTGKILRYNRAESALSRLDPLDVIGRNFFRDVAPCTAVRECEGRFEAFARGSDSAVERFEWPFMFRWGRQDVMLALIRREHRPEIHLVVTVKSTARSLELEDEGGPASDAVVAQPANDPLATEVGLWADDPSSGALYRSDELHRMLAAGAELDETRDPLVRYAHPESVAALTDAMTRARDSGNAYSLATRLVAGDGTEREVFVHGSYLGPPGGASRFSFGSVVDLTKRRTVGDGLWRAAHLDPLTELPNRRLVLERLTETLRERSSGVAVCFLDLDRFKSVNDSAGHAAGDRLLQLVAERLLRSTRPTDIVARINGDEFVIVLIDGARPTMLDPAMNRILEAVGEPYAIDGREHRVTASAGVARYPTDGETAEVLLSAADDAMYRAKARGPGAFCRYTVAMRDDSASERERSAELFFAIGRGEIVTYFQPIVRAVTHELVAVEALARWQHATLGTLEPETFVPLAEENGAIFALGERILEEACTWGRTWYDALHERAPVVSVNVSPLQFRDRRFVETVREVLAATGMPARKLELELTESLVMDRFDETLVRLAELKSLGVRLSIDDFGTGYSSLAHLKYFPIDTIKLDRAFIVGVGSDPVDEAIVETIVALAHALQVSVIAEGVESERQARRLEAFACQAMQGHLFGRAATAADTDALVRRG
ncbi:MAG: EAL domain-containing protein [Vulcanimicrobiaceae bacterium]